MSTRIKTITALVIALWSALSMSAQSTDSLPAQSAEPAATTTPEAQPAIPVEKIIADADSAYASDNFQLAAQLYSQAIERQGTSATLIYNLGNTYYRQGNLGMAVVCYERALRLDPTDEYARANLEFVQTKLTDRQIDDGSVMTTVKDSVVQTFKANTWAWIAIALFAIFIGCVAVYLFAVAVPLRKTSFFGGIVVFLLTIVCVLISFAAANRTTTHDEAIVLPPAAQLSTTPREARNQAEHAFLLHEGTKVVIVDSISTATEGKWYEVRVGAKERAWIKASEVERI